MLTDGIRFLSKKLADHFSRNLKLCSVWRRSLHQAHIVGRVKGKLRTMKVDTPEFRGLFTPELNKLIDLFKKHDYELRIAGGAVRDLLMGKQPHDVDFATTATPNQMKEMFELEGIRMINNKGESHGTITARINDKENFEVTTLRIDVRTDGRHAEVQFTKDWELDANRRDLTINAMFLDLDGTLYDYFQGQEDLLERKVRFVGDPASRIQEDYLRILRYFRFYGRIAKSPNDHEEKTLHAIQENGAGLAGISGERIWLEFKKIVCGNFAGNLIKIMHDVGVTQYIGLPEKPNVEEFEEVYSRAHHLDPQPMTYMSALLSKEEEVYQLNKRLKMSNDELKLGTFILQYRGVSMGDSPIRHCQHLFIDNPGKDVKVRALVTELVKYLGDQELVREFSQWSPPPFPVSGYDLVGLGVRKGPRFAKLIHELRQLWKQSDFKMTKEELLEHVDDILK
ncbi:hypothetical protein ACJMK2_036112 [Sinanodonta woodiana]|uniref:Uncharacterized protein n=1 Tax=Sinanodonta woodiana TaxID=1069815 RepID=A0ABD3WHC4_SINWO